VSKREGEEFAGNNECLFAEVSGLHNGGVELVFEGCARTVLAKIEAGVLDPRDARGVVVGDGEGVDFVLGASEGRIGTC
jgi:hypothetical protein